MVSHVSSLFLQSLISTRSRLVITSSDDSSADSVLCSDAICIEVPSDDIRVGDSVLVLPGETIPTDVSHEYVITSGLSGSYTEFRKLGTYTYIYICAFI